MKFEKQDDGTYILDVCGYVCPHPQLYAKKSLEKISEGEKLTIIFDNPSSGESIAQMCDQAGHEMLEQKEEGGKIYYIIEKG